MSRIFFYHAFVSHHTVTPRPISYTSTHDELACNYRNPLITKDLRLRGTGFAKYKASTNFMRGKLVMKRYITAILMSLMLFVMMPFATATDTMGQTRRVRHRTHAAYYYKKPNFYRRHRKAINIAGGAAGGALLGGLIGGRKGAGIGALAGAGGGYVFTRKQHSKHHYTRHYIRRY